MASLISGGSRNLKVWFARGFTARLQKPPTLSGTMPPGEGVDFKGDPLRHTYFIEGWEAGEKELHRVLEQIASPGERAERLRQKEKEVWSNVRKDRVYG